MIVLTLSLEDGAWEPIREHLSALAARFPGGHGLTVVVGQRTLALGPEWTYDPNAACLWALGEHGRVEVFPA